MVNTYGFIGCGNMGGALAAAACSAVDPSCVFVADPAADKVSDFVGKTGAVASTNDYIAANCSMIFLGVKPQVMADVLAPLADILRSREDRFVLITMAAGLSISRIQEMAGNYPTIRIMPNLPVQCGEGVVLMCSAGVKEAELAEFASVMGKAGEIVAIEEDLINAGCALSGCAPAYVFMFIDALTKGAVECGLAKEAAQELAIQTIIGSAQLLASSDKDPIELKDAVCSPGGATIEGVKALDAGSFSSVAASSIVAAYKRTLELS